MFGSSVPMTAFDFMMTGADKSTSISFKVDPKNRHGVVQSMELTGS
jgi:hypothetical protein